MSLMASGEGPGERDRARAAAPRAQLMCRHILLPITRIFKAGAGGRLGCDVGSSPSTESLTGKPGHGRKSLALDSSSPETHVTLILFLWGPFPVQMPQSPWPHRGPWPSVARPLPCQEWRQWSRYLGWSWPGTLHLHRAGTPKGSASSLLPADKAEFTSVLRTRQDHLNQVAKFSF